MPDRRGCRRKWKATYGNVGSMTVCPFCGPQKSPLAENETALAIDDKRPISPGHCLIILRQHVPSIFMLPLDAYLGCFALVRTVQELLASSRCPAGFNLVVNNGAAAGQTVEHAHIHIVPRYPGDLLKPDGRLREFLPGPGSPSL